MSNRALRTWAAALAVLAAVRVAIPLAALAASGRQLPGLPHYRYEGLTGDATGFYATSREFIASFGKLGKAGAGLLALAALAAVAVLAWLARTRRLRPAWALVGGVAVVMLAVTIAVTKMTPSGAAVFGWPLVWSIPMFPLRAVHHLNPRIAFGVGLPIALAANAVTVVATGVIGLRATGRRGIGLAAAAVYAFWPLLMGLVGGSRAWGNGTWTVDAGLAMYTEPLSTALVAVAVALVLARRLGELPAAVAGLCFGLAALTKLSNGFLAVIVLALLLHRCGRARAAVFAAGALAFAPAVIAYWPKGYVPVFDNPKSFPPTPFSVSYVWSSWHDSYLFSVRTLLVLVPVAVVGALGLSWRWAALVLGLTVLFNAAFYSFFANTSQHPRFLFVSLPAVFVLWVTGAATLAELLRRRLRAPAPA
jgi:hypothetical protein